MGWTGEVPPNSGQSSHERYVDRSTTGSLGVSTYLLFINFVSVHCAQSHNHHIIICLGNNIIRIYSVKVGTAKILNGRKPTGLLLRILDLLGNSYFDNQFEQWMSPNNILNDNAAVPKCKHGSRFSKQRDSISYSYSFQIFFRCQSISHISWGSTWNKRTTKIAKNRYQ